MRLLKKLDDVCQARTTNEGLYMLELFQHINQTIQQEYDEYMSIEERGQAIKGADEFGQGKQWYEQPSGREHTLRGVDKGTHAYVGNVNNRVKRSGFWRCPFGSGKHYEQCDCCHQCRMVKRWTQKACLLVISLPFNKYNFTGTMVRHT